MPDVLALAEVVDKHVPVRLFTFNVTTSPGLNALGAPPSVVTGSEVELDVANWLPFNNHE
jgi:hypothetical protein